MLKSLFQKLRDTIKKSPFIESILYFFYYFFVDYKSYQKKIKFGFCSFCGAFTIMLLSSLYNKKTIKLIDTIIFRETGICIRCSANNKRRFVGELIKKIIFIKSSYKDFSVNKLRNLLNHLDLKKYSLKNIIKKVENKDFYIYEPGSYGPIHNILKKNPYYIFSEYFPYPNLIGGQFFNGIRFEDLHSLSFKDNSIDLIITIDVLEHVQYPIKVFNEIYRVLKPNGIHICTVPIAGVSKTFYYFDDQGNPKCPLAYHDDPLRSEGVLVYTQFGNDIIDILNESGFPSFFVYSKIDPKNGLFHRTQVIITIKS